MSGAVWNISLIGRHQPLETDPEDYILLSDPPRCGEPLPHTDPVTLSCLPCQDELINPESVSENTSFLSWIALYQVFWLNEKESR